MRRAFSHVLRPAADSQKATAHACGVGLLHAQVGASALVFTPDADLRPGTVHSRRAIVCCTGNQSPKRRTSRHTGGCCCNVSRLMA